MLKRCLKPPHTFHVSIFQTFFGQQGEGEKVSRIWELSKALLSSHLLHNYFCHFSCEWPSATLWMLSRRRSEGRYIHIETIIASHTSLSASHTAFECETKKVEQIIQVLWSLHWLPVCHRFDFKTIRLLWKALNGFGTKCIFNLP